MAFKARLYFCVVRVLKSVPPSLHVINCRNIGCTQEDHQTTQYTITIIHSHPSLLWWEEYGCHHRNMLQWLRPQHLGRHLVFLPHLIESTRQLLHYHNPSRAHQRPLNKSSNIKKYVLMTEVTIVTVEMFTLIPWMAPLPLIPPIRCRLTDFPVKICNFCNDYRYNLEVHYKEKR